MLLLILKLFKLLRFFLYIFEVVLHYISAGKLPYVQVHKNFPSMTALLYSEVPVDG